MWFLSLLFALIVIAAAVAFGARFHNQVNVRITRIFGQAEQIPPDFELWLSNHKGEYETLGKAMGAWADAKFGNKYDELLR